MLAFLKNQNFFLFELFVVFKILAILSPNIATNMIVQDKLCLVNHHQSSHFCQNLQNKMEYSKDQKMKNEILTEAARFTNYKNLVETIPILFWSLFLGPFLDAYPNATYLIFLVNIFGDCFASIVNLVLIYFYNTSPYLHLIASLSIWLSGGMMSFGSTAGLYITSNSGEKSRAMKFVILEIIIVLGYAVSMFMGGQFLRNKDDGPQLRTYHFNYFFTLSLDAICLLLIFLLYCVKGPDTRKAGSSTETLKKSIDNDDESSQAIAETTKSSALKVFFNIDNARQTLNAFFRARPNHVRLQIFLLCFVQYSQLLISTGLNNLMVQFAQSVYHWGPSTYSTVFAINLVTSMVLLAFMSAIFITWLKLSDSNLILLAQISNFLADLIRGSFLSPLAYLISIPVGSLNGFGIVSAKAKFSKIVPKNEAGKIFSLNATIEALVPLGSVIYSYLFTVSISTYPGLIYHFSCLLMILTVGALIVEKRFCPVTGQEKKTDAKEATAF